MDLRQNMTYILIVLEKNVLVFDQSATSATAILPRMRFKYSPV